MASFVRSRLRLGYKSARSQRAVFNPHALPLTERRRLAIREVTRLAAFHPHAYRIIGFAAQMFFDRIAAQATAERAENRHACSTASSSELVSDKTACDRAAYRTNAGSLAFMPYGGDCFYRTASRAIGGLGGLLLCVVGLLYRLLLLRHLRRWRLLLLLLGGLGCCSLLSLLLSKLVLLRLLLLGSSRLSWLRHGRLRRNLRGLGLVVGRRGARRFREQSSDRCRGSKTSNDHRARGGCHQWMNFALTRGVGIR